MSLDDKKWLIITTDNLPEAYVMVQYLISKSQDVSLLNIKGRTLSQSVGVLKRLAKRRGILYLADFILARKLKKYYIDSAVPVFPDVNDSVINNVKKSITCYNVEDPHSKDTLCIVKEMTPDYILFLGAPVIKPVLFNLATHGTINWHHGLSPLYKGSDCVIWPMAKNDFNNIGFTIHYVAEIVDGGRIILQRRVMARNDLEFSEAIADILRQGMEGFIEVVENIILNKSIEGKEQEKGGRHYPPAGLSTVRRAYKNFHHFAHH